MTMEEAWAAKHRARNIGDFRHWKDHEKYIESLKRVPRDLNAAAINDDRTVPSSVHWPLVANVWHEFADRSERPRDTFTQ